MAPTLPSACTTEGQPAGTILKSSPRVRLEEVEALRLARRVGLPVPEVYEVRELPEKGMEFSMELIPGERLEDVRPGMTAEEKTRIATELRQLIVLMRSVPGAEGQVIGACGGPARDCQRINDFPGGPFTTEHAFNDFLVDLYSSTPPLIRQAIRTSLKDNHRINFTHADLSPRNIIVSNGRIAGLVDWEYSGWYPEYWEYVKFFTCVTSCRDWKKFADVIFETKYPLELAYHQALVTWQRP